MHFIKGVIKNFVFYFVASFAVILFYIVKFFAYIVVGVLGLVCFGHAIATIIFFCMGETDKALSSLFWVFILLAIPALGVALWTYIDDNFLNAPSKKMKEDTSTNN